MSSELEVRVSELEKKLSDLAQQHHEVTHKSLKQFTDHILLQQRQIGSLRGPEGARGEPGQSIVGPAGRDGKDGMSEADIKKIVESSFQALLANARKEVAAELAKLQSAVAEFQKNAQAAENRSKTVLADAQKSLQAQIEAFRARLQSV